MSDRWLLMFAYHFPPENVIGALRPFRFYKYLPEFGFRCYVITAADISGVPGIEGQHVPDPFTPASPRNFTFQKERLIRKLLLPGTVGIGWSSRAVAAAEIFLRDKPLQTIAIFSTYPPLGPHLAARILSRRYRLPWIADFRDPLAGNPVHNRLGAQTHATHSWLERGFVRNANALLANTDEAERQLRTRYPRHAGKIHLLWNGFDPAARVKPLPIPSRLRRIYSHVGELYQGRTAAPLLNTLAALITSGKLSPDIFQIRLVGPVDPSCLPSPALVNEAQAKGWLQITPQQVPQPEAQQIAQTSDGLLLIQPQSSIQVPGKLYDYLQIGRPILAVLPSQSAVERLLAKSGIPHRILRNQTFADLTACLLLEFFSLPSEPVAPAPWFEETFNCRTQTATLSAILNAAQVGQQSR